jgi:hypothetical protein
MTLCQLIKAIDDFNGKFGIGGVSDVFFLYGGVNQYARLLGLFTMQGPYYQYFCGYSNYMPGMPCNATELVHFRKRIGVKGFNLIFKMAATIPQKFNIVQFQR